MSRWWCPSCSTSGGVQPAVGVSRQDNDRALPSSYQVMPAPAVSLVRAPSGTRQNNRKPAQQGDSQWRGQSPGDALTSSLSVGARTVAVMLETPEEVAALQALLDASHTSSSSHLKEIVNDDHTLSASDLVALLTGMKVLSVATVTARAEPRISALDGHFLHGTWTFGTGRHRRQGRTPEQAPSGQRGPRRRREAGRVQPRPGRAAGASPRCLVRDHRALDGALRLVAADLGPGHPDVLPAPAVMVGYAADRASLLEQRTGPSSSDVTGSSSDESGSEQAV